MQVNNGRNTPSEKNLSCNGRGLFTNYVDKKRQVDSPKSVDFLSTDKEKNGNIW